MRNLGTNLTNTWAALGFGIVWSAIFFSWKKVSNLCKWLSDSLLVYSKVLFWGRDWVKHYLGIESLKQIFKKKRQELKWRAKTLKILMKLNETGFFYGCLFFILRAWGIEKLSVHGRIELVASQRYILLRKDKTRGKQDYIFPRHVWHISCVLLGSALLNTRFLCGDKR